MNVVIMELSFLHEPLLPVSSVVYPNLSGILLDEFNQLSDAVTCLTLGLAFVVSRRLSWSVLPYFVPTLCTYSVPL